MIVIVAPVLLCIYQCLHMQSWWLTFWSDSTYLFHFYLHFICLKFQFLFVVDSVWWMWICKINFWHPVWVSMCFVSSDRLSDPFLSVFIFFLIFFCSFSFAWKWNGYDDCCLTPSLTFITWCKMVIKSTFSDPFL